MSSFITRFILIVILIIASCNDKPTDTDNGDYPNIITTQESALELVKAKFFSFDTIFSIYSLNKIVPAGTEITVQEYPIDTPMVNFHSWFFFVDLDYPRTSFPRHCEYVFVDVESDLLESFTEYFPPQNFGELEPKYPVIHSTQNLSREEAFNLLTSQYLGSDPKSLVLAADKIFDLTDTIYVDGGDNYYNPGYANWFFFIDREYIVSDIWPRYCQYAFVNSITGFIQVTFDTRPPTILSELDTVYHKWHLQNYDKPDLTFSDSCNQFGCSDIRVYAENEVQNAILSVKADKSELSLNPIYTEFDLSKDTPGLEVKVDFYYYLPEYYRSMAFRYCNDVIAYVRPQRNWFAKSGIIRIAVSENNRATIELNHVEFFDINGEKPVILEHLLLSNIAVGLYPG